MKSNKKFTVTAAAVTAAIVLAASGAAMGDHGGKSGCDRSSSGSSSSSKATASKAVNALLRLVGRVGSDNNGGIKTAVKYEERTRRNKTARKFDVEVENLTPGTVLNVMIKGATVATITADEFGEAKLELRPSPDDANELPMPSDFPSLKAGDVVTVGDVQVTLRAR